MKSSETDEEIIHENSQSRKSNEDDDNDSNKSSTKSSKIKIPLEDFVIILIVNITELAKIF